jgi:hypothetical protein
MFFSWKYIFKKLFLTLKSSKITINNINLIFFKNKYFLKKHVKIKVIVYLKIKRINYLDLGYIWDCDIIIVLVIQSVFHLKIH